VKYRRNRPIEPGEEREGRTDGKRLNQQGRALLKQSRRPTFRCFNCKADVPTEAVGTKHRNHCPICLWSRHVDDSVGDRRSSCLSSMEPIGLSQKGSDGEIMIVHKCVSCGRVNRNRVAGDDNALSILGLLKSSLSMDESNVYALRSLGINLCTDYDQIAKRFMGRVE